MRMDSTRFLLIGGALAIGVAVAWSAIPERRSPAIPSDDSAQLRADSNGSSRRGPAPVRSAVTVPGEREAKPSRARDAGGLVSVDGLPDDIRNVVARAAAGARKAVPGFPEEPLITLGGAMALAEHFRHIQHSYKAVSNDYSRNLMDRVDQQIASGETLKLTKKPFDLIRDMRERGDLSTHDDHCARVRCMGAKRSRWHSDDLLHRSVLQPSVALTFCRRYS